MRKKMLTFFYELHENIWGAKLHGKIRIIFLKFHLKINISNKTLISSFERKFSDVIAAKGWNLKGE